MQDARLKTPLKRKFGVLHASPDLLSSRQEADPSPIHTPSGSFQHLCFTLDVLEFHGDVPCCGNFCIHCSGTKSWHPLALEHSLVGFHCFLHLLFRQCGDPVAFMLHFQAGHRLLPFPLCFVSLCSIPLFKRLLCFLYEYFLCHILNL